MADLCVAYNTPNGVDINVEIKTTTKREYTLNRINTSVEDEILFVTLPTSFTHYKYMIVSDKQGVILKGSVTEKNTTKTNTINVSLKCDDTMAFVYVECSVPEHREFTKFITLNRPKPETKYKDVSYLLELIEKKLDVNSTLNCWKPMSQQ